jgi:hypothetical protein
VRCVQQVLALFGAILERGEDSGAQAIRFDELPTHPDEFHAVAEQRHKHRGEEIPEAALRPQQLSSDSR